MRFLYQVKQENKALAGERERKKSPPGSPQQLPHGCFTRAALIYEAQSAAARRPAGRRRSPPPPNRQPPRDDEPPRRRTLARPQWPPREPYVDDNNSYGEAELPREKVTPLFLLSLPVALSRALRAAAEEEGCGGATTVGPLGV